MGLLIFRIFLQSPGIYYRSELDHNGISVYTGTIISDWGGRLELEIESELTTRGGSPADR